MSQVLPPSAGRKVCVSFCLLLSVCCDMIYRYDLLLFSADFDNWPKTTISKIFPRVRGVWGGAAPANAVGRRTVQCGSCSAGYIVVGTGIKLMSKLPLHIYQMLAGRITALWLYIKPAHQFDTLVTGVVPAGQDGQYSKLCRHELDGRHRTDGQ